MTDYLERRFSGLETLPVPQEDLDAVVARGQAVKRAARAKVAGSTLLLLLTIGLLATQVDLRNPQTLLPADTSRYVDTNHGYSAELPEGWFGSTPSSGGDPRPIGIFATFPTDEERYGTSCGPDFEGLRYVSPEEAVVTMSERYYSPETGGRIQREFDPRPSDIGPKDATLFPYGRDFYREGCPDTDNEWWQVAFRDNGRGFYVTLQFGSKLSATEREEVWEFLDTFEFDRRDGLPEDSDYVRYEDEASGFSIVYPKTWTRADSSLTPNLSDPSELFSVASFPLEYRETDCGNMPKSAFEDMGPRDVFVSIQERFGSGEGTGGFKSRPHSFKGAEPFVLECVPERLTSHWIRFKDAGRRFYALAVFGADAPLGLKDEAWAVLDSFEPLPR